MHVVALYVEGCWCTCVVVLWCTQCTMHVHRCAPACIRVLVNLGRYAFDTQLSAYDIHPVPVP
jgi:hypothetical protein